MSRQANVAAARVVPLHYSAGALHRVVPARRASSAATLVAWIALIGLLLPAWEMQISIADAKFTIGRTGVMLLMLPALAALCGRGRRLVSADLFAAAAAVWILLAPVAVDGFDALKSAGAVSVEFIGGYLVGRAFFGEMPALDAFVRVLKVLTLAAVAVALLDLVSGRWLAHDIAAAMFGTTALGPVFREGIVRAASTFDHPILFGVYCSLAGAIFLFHEQRMAARMFYVAVCLLGAVLSQSSASLLSFALVFCAYGYDRVMRAVPYHWAFFWAAVAAALAAVFFGAERPIGWLITHLTLDPETGYYRILIWDAALERIGASPIAGYAFNPFGEMILDATVDSVWLVLALRFGLPLVVLLALANLAAMLPVGRRPGAAGGEPEARMRLAFSLLLLLFMFDGLTVHFWNYMWIFWGICIGIRAALREQRG